MLKRLCTAKIANAFVTHTELKYDGSIGLDRSMLEASGILPSEMVLIANVSNGRRFETYTIPEPAGSGRVCLYGAAAHMASVGHELIVMAYGYFEAAEAARFHGPRVVRLLPGNKPA
jgi:aspartate 1-decarboxylase